MGQACNGDHGQYRCDSCRYWFERCCHALALADGSDQKPQNCGHFARMPSSDQADTAEAAPC